MNRYSNRRLFAGLAGVVLAGSTGAAHARVISQYLEATVSGSQTTDTAGIFGIAGGSLAGQKITVYAQYVSTDFSPVISCGTGCELNFSKGNPAAGTRIASTPGSILVVIGVNGKHIAYAPAMQSTIEADNNVNNSGAHTLQFFSESATSKPGYANCVVSVSYSSPTSFGALLSPDNSPVVGQSVDSLAVTQASGQSEILTFSVDRAGR